MYHSPLASAAAARIACSVAALSLSRCSLCLIMVSTSTITTSASERRRSLSGGRGSGGGEGVGGWACERNGAPCRFESELPGPRRSTAPLRRRPQPRGLSSAASPRPRRRRRRRRPPRPPSPHPPGPPPPLPRAPPRAPHPLPTRRCRCASRRASRTLCRSRRCSVPPAWRSGTDGGGVGERGVGRGGGRGAAAGGGARGRRACMPRARPRSSHGGGGRRPGRAAGRCSARALRRRRPCMRGGCRAPRRGGRRPSVGGRSARRSRRAPGRRRPRRPRPPHLLLRFGAEHEVDQLVQRGRLLQRLGRVAVERARHQPLHPRGRAADPRPRCVRRNGGGPASSRAAPRAGRGAEGALASEHFGGRWREGAGDGANGWKQCAHPFTPAPLGRRRRGTRTGQRDGQTSPRTAAPGPQGRGDRRFSAPSGVNRPPGRPGGEGGGGPRGNPDCAAPRGRPARQRAPKRA
jgi:hypothetical protein